MPASLLQRGLAAVDAGAALHGVVHRLAQAGDGLAAALAHEQLADASLGGFGSARAAALALPIGLALANAAALRPARAPNTRSSVSELEPRRLAPLIDTQAHSPAANRPGKGVAASMSVWMPPIV